ncbi:hypothetical protein [Hyphomonas sp.]|uniref:hypothetical protein n=1 Tax=Hyphomonas sp. TaxID=87 RepID=UPI00391ACC65
MSFVRLPTAGVSLFLIGAGVALLYLLAVLTASGSTAARPETPVQPGLTAPVLPALTVISDEDTSAAAEKPLFHPDRRPFQGPGIPASAAIEPGRDGSVPPFALRGVVLSDGMARASLAHQDTGDIRWITRGGMIDGWQLQQVRPGSVVLGRDGQNVTLQLHAGRQVAPAD